MTTSKMCNDSREVGLWVFKRLLSLEAHILAILFPPLIPSTIGAQVGLCDLARPLTSDQKLFFLFLEKDCANLLRTR